MSGETILAAAAGSLAGYLVGTGARKESAMPESERSRVLVPTAIMRSDGSYNSNGLTEWGAWLEWLPADADHATPRFRLAVRAARPAENSALCIPVALPDLADPYTGGRPTYPESVPVASLVDAMLEIKWTDAGDALEASLNFVNPDWSADAEGEAHYLQAIVELEADADQKHYYVDEPITLPETTSRPSIPVRVTTDFVGGKLKFSSGTALIV